MCSVCRRYLCPAGCPSYVGRSAEYGKRRFRCSKCGTWLYEDDDYIIDYGKPYCIACQKITSRADDTSAGGKK